MRSTQGVGTTVRVSVPLRRPLLTPTAVATTSLADLSFLNVSVRFLGFGALDTDPTAEPLRSKANKRLLNSLKRGCRQLGLPICATDDNLDNNAAISVVQMEALEGLSQTNDGGVRHSLLSSNNLRRPLVVICPTRDSALKLRVTPVASSFPSGAQYIWHPVGPVKLADAISNCCMSYNQVAVNVDVIESGIADLLLVNPRTGDGHSAAALDAPQSSPSHEAANSAHVQPDVDQNLASVDSFKNGASSDFASADYGAVHETGEVSQPAMHKRSGSEASSRPSIPSIQIRTQIGRATTAPYRSAWALSLLLVDDNVSYTFKLTTRLY